MFSDLINSLRNAGWQVQETNAPLPDAIRARYSWVPEEVLAFLETLWDATNASETAWIVTADVVSEPRAFRWNEWELLGAEAGGADAEWRDEIRTFWDNHFPFLLSVKDGYAYFAIRNAMLYPVVYGREPDFEKPLVVAGTFGEWVELVVEVIAGRIDSFEIENAL